MKKIWMAATVLAISGASLQTAKAGDREWATAGKFLTGVVAGAVIASALDCPPAHASVTYTYSAPACCPPPAPVVYVPLPRVVVTPTPVVVYRAPVCAPRPVVIKNVGHRGHHAWGHSHRR